MFGARRSRGRWRRNFNGKATRSIFFFLTMLGGSEDHEIFTLLFDIHAS